MASDIDKKQSNRLPGRYKQFIAEYPALDDAHEAIARAVAEAGPLDARTCELVKIGLSVGAGLESALRAHVRKAMQAGATRREIEQAILLAMNTLGFPRTVAAWSWAQIQFERDKEDAGGE